MSYSERFTHHKGESEELDSLYSEVFREIYRKICEKIIPKNETDFECLASVTKKICEYKTKSGKGMIDRLI